MRVERLFIILLFVLIAFSACKKRGNDDIVRLVEKWKNREIIYPNELYFTLYGKDTVQYPQKMQYTIISYVDSAGCLSCKLRLPMWRQFIQQLDSIYSDKVCVLLFLHSKSKIELYHLLKNCKFNYPVCIDEDDKLNRLNHFPSDMSFQTFLLDKDNKVLAIGNPIHNPKVKELYLKIIQGEIIGQDKETEVIKTKVAMDKTSISLGHFDWQKEQKATFTLKNTGNKPLVIQDVNTSCGCTSVAYSKEPVQPSGELKLEVIYKAEHSEHFNKTITVYCNAESSPLVLKIMGDAIIP